MRIAEIKLILKRLYREYVRAHLKKIFISLILSIIVAGSTSGIAWLLDPAVKKIFIEKNTTLSWVIPILIIVAFAGKGISLYFARLLIIRVGEEVSGTIKKEIAENIVRSDIQTIDSRHSGKYISNVMFDAGQVQSLVSTGVLNLMKDTFSVLALVGVMVYQNWKLALFAMLMMPLAAKKEKKLLTSNSPVAINCPEKAIKPAIIMPVKVSINGAALINTLEVLIFFSITSSITSLASEFIAFYF